MQYATAKPRRETAYIECAERTLRWQIPILEDFEQLFLKVLLHNTLWRKKNLKFLGFRADTPFPRLIVNRASCTNYTHHPSQSLHPLQPIISCRIAVELHESPLCIHAKPAGQIASDS